MLEKSFDSNKSNWPCLKNLIGPILSNLTIGWLFGSINGIENAATEKPESRNFWIVCFPSIKPPEWPW